MRTDRTRWLLALGMLATPAASMAGTCVTTNVGATCPPTPGPDVQVTAVAGCCILVTAPGLLERTGISGEGDPATATLVVHLDGRRAGLLTMTTASQQLRASYENQVVTVTTRTGCCVEVEADGSPVRFGRTGIYGGNAISVWLRGRPLVSCPWANGPQGVCEIGP